MLIISKKTKKLIAGMLSLIMLFSLIPGAFAEETAQEPIRHILIVYFSATGTTKGVAEKMQEALNADIYEIVPEAPYSLTQKLI